jgi:hypothetical protein
MAIALADGVEAVNGFGFEGWGGPCPPEGEVHRYVFSIMAYNESDSLIGKGTFIATYGRTGDAGEQNALVAGSPVPLEQSSPSSSSPGNGFWRELTSQTNAIEGGVAVFVNDELFTDPSKDEKIDGYWGYLTNGHETYTDSEGYYSFNDLEAGLYNLAVFREDQYLRTIIHRAAGSNDNFTQTVALKGVPELTLEASGQKDGDCTLVWSQETIFSADRGSGSVFLTGVGYGFDSSMPPPSLMVEPDPQNTGNGILKLEVSVNVDGRLDLRINTATFHDTKDKYYIRYRTALTGLDFWGVDWNSSGTVPKYLTLTPDSGNNAVETPLFSSKPGDLYSEFNATVWDDESNIVKNQPISWSWRTDFNKSSLSNPSLAELNSTGTFRLYSTLRKGRLVSVEIVDGGEGYSDDNSSKLVFVGSSGQGAAARIAEVNASGAIKRVEILDFGEGFSAGNLSVSVIDSNGTGAFLRPVVGSGRITIRAELDMNSSIYAEVNATASGLHVLEQNATLLWLDRYFDTFLPGDVNMSSDPDGDGLTNAAELLLFTNPNWSDSDGDGLDDWNESQSLGTNPLLADTDTDGLSDYAELMQYNTDPTKFDTDGDGWSDGLEVSYGLSPTQAASGIGYVSGIIYFHGNSSGKLYLSPNEIPEEKSVLDHQPFQEFTPTPANYYFFNNLQTGNETPYKFFAFIDRDGDKIFDKGEPSGSYEGVWDGLLSGDKTDVNLRVVDPPPELEVLGNSTIILNSGETFVDPGAYAYDQWENPQLWSVTPSGNATNITIDSPPGVYHAIYSATDSSQSAVTKNRVIVILDQVAPVITLENDVGATIHEAGAQWVEPGYSAQDNVDGSIAGQVVIEGATVNETTPPGSYVIKYSVTDSSGNKDEIFRNVSIVDTTAPILNLVGGADLTHEFGKTWNDPGYSATDWNGSLVASVVATTLENTQELAPGQYSVTYNVSDSLGNQATTVTRTIRIVDGHSPLITLLGENPLRHEAGTKFNEPGYSAYDDVDGNVTIDVNVSGIVGVAKGFYDLVYSVSDKSDNIVTATREVQVVDNTSPAFTLFGGAAVDHEKGKPFVDPGYSAYDLADGDLSSSVFVTGDTVDPNISGSYDITYAVIDSSGNSAKVDRTVNIKDWIYTLGGKALDGYLINASVIFDVDGDRSHDLSTSVVTDENGAYILTFTQKEFSEVDKNNNGLIDHDEGRISVSGGFDSSTLKPFTGTFEADANSTVVTPLTTLATVLIDLNPGLSREQAYGTISEAMGIAATVDLSSYDPISGASEGEVDARSTLTAGARVANVIRQASALMNYASSETADDSMFPRKVLEEVVKKIESGANVPLGEVDEMQAILQAAISSSSFENLITDSDLAGVSQMMVTADELIEESAATDLSPAKLASEIATIQAVVEDSVITGYDKIRLDGGTLSSLSNSLSKELLTGQKSSYTGINVFPPKATNANVALAKDRLEEANASVYTILVSDPDSDKVQFTVASGNPDADSDGNLAFSINADGLIRVNDADDLSNLSSSDVTTLEVRMADGEGLFGTVSVAVQLDNPLAFESDKINGFAKWKHSVWLGNFYSNGSSWIYHESLGWLYVLSDQSGGFWFWDSARQSWWWTKEEVSPYFFMHDDPQPWWGFWDFTSNPLKKYNFSENRWTEEVR